MAQFITGFRRRNEMRKIALKKRENARKRAEAKLLEVVREGGYGNLLEAYRRQSRVEEKITREQIERANRASALIKARKLAKRGGGIVRVTPLRKRKNNG